MMRIEDHKEKEVSLTNGIATTSGKKR